MRNKNSESGNGMFELLLFAPVGLLFLFLVTDAGMALHDRSGVIDAARAALLARSKAAGLSETYGEDGFDHAEQRAFLLGVTDDILAGVARTRGNTRDASPPFVHLALVRLTFDTATGELSAYALERPDAQRNPESAIDCGGDTLDDFLRANLERETGRSPSALALPLSPSFAADADHFLGLRFLLAARVCGLSRGITAHRSASFLGRFFQFHEEQLLPLRIQTEHR